MINQRKESERIFHDERFGGDDSTRQAARKFYMAAKPAQDYFWQRVSVQAAGRQVLEIGCGKGKCAQQFIDAGARLTAVDLSSEGIKVARQQACAAGYDIDYRVMDAEELEFPADSFDLVVGLGILHHLQYDAALAGLARVLRSGGTAIFCEPLGHNPLINLYRRLTPQMRTVDEHPLLLSDFKVFRRYFANVNYRAFVCLSLLAIPLRRLPGFSGLLNGLAAVDRCMFCVMPFTRRFAWQVILEMKEPVKPAAASDVPLQL